MRRTTSAILCLMAASSVAASMSGPSGPFYQQDQHLNGLANTQGDDAQSLNLPHQMAFTNSQDDDLEVDGEMSDNDNEDDGEMSDDDTSLKDSKHHRHRDGWLYLIRHGEKVKESDKTGLSERGLQRAKCLMDVFGNGGSKATYPIDYILAQDFKPSGQRRRPYETVKPLAKKHHLPLDHSCDRDDTKCAIHHIRKRTEVGHNVLVVWEHARLSNIAKALGVKGLVYPSNRYDIVFKIRGKKVHSIFSEECQGLDEKWVDWQPERRGKHGKAPHGGRLINDESWAD